MRYINLIFWFFFLGKLYATIRQQVKENLMKYVKTNLEIGYTTFNSYIQYWILSKAYPRTLVRYCSVLSLLSLSCNHIV